MGQIAGLTFSFKSPFIRKKLKEKGLFINMENLTPKYNPGFFSFLPATTLTPGVDKY